MVLVVPHHLMEGIPTGRSEGGRDGEGREGRMGRGGREGGRKEGGGRQEKNKYIYIYTVESLIKDTPE